MQELIKKLSDKYDEYPKHLFSKEYIIITPYNIFAYTNIVARLLAVNNNKYTSSFCKQLCPIYFKNPLYIHNETTLRNYENNDVKITKEEFLSEVSMIDDFYEMDIVSNAIHILDGNYFVYENMNSDITYFDTYFNKCINETPKSNNNLCIVFNPYCQSNDNSDRHKKIEVSKHSDYETDFIYECEFRLKEFYRSYCSFLGISYDIIEPYNAYEKICNIFTRVRNCTSAEFSCMPNCLIYNTNTLDQIKKIYHKDDLQFKNNTRCSMFLYKEGSSGRALVINEETRNINYLEYLQMKAIPEIGQYLPQIYDYGPGYYVCDYDIDKIHIESLDLIDFNHTYSKYRFMPHKSYKFFIRSGLYNFHCMYSVIEFMNLSFKHNLLLYTISEFTRNPNDANDFKLLDMYMENISTLIGPNDSLFKNEGDFFNYIYLKTINFYSIKEYVPTIIEHIDELIKLDIDPKTIKPAEVFNYDMSVKEFELMIIKVLILNVNGNSTEIVYRQEVEICKLIKIIYELRKHINVSDIFDISGF